MWRIFLKPAAANLPRKPPDTRRNHTRSTVFPPPATAEELDRQRHQIASASVLAAQGSVLTNKYAEGYPGKR